MTLFAPFDGTPLSTAALGRANELAAQTDQRLVAATVVPRDRRMAVDHRWLAEDEPFDSSRIERRLTRRVVRVAPIAEYRTERVEGRLSPGGIARRLRDIAREVDASTVVMGSDNIGRSVRPADTVSGKVASRLEIDLYIVQGGHEDIDPLVTGE